MITGTYPHPILAIAERCAILYTWQVIYLLTTGRTLSLVPTGDSVMFRHLIINDNDMTIQEAGTFLANWYTYLENAGYDGDYRKFYADDMIILLNSDNLTDAISKLNKKVNDKIPF